MILCAGALEIPLERSFDICRLTILSLQPSSRRGSQPPTLRSNTNGRFKPRLALAWIRVAKYVVSFQKDSDAPVTRLVY